MSSRFDDRILAHIKTLIKHGFLLFYLHELLMSFEVIFKTRAASFLNGFKNSLVIHEGNKENQYHDGDFTDNLVLIEYEFKRI